jgi:hypothetical protein
MFLVQERLKIKILKVITHQGGCGHELYAHSKIENSYLEKNSCRILILSNILLKIRKTRENILIKN